jgi:hypothetical protein
MIIEETTRNLMGWTELLHERRLWNRAGRHHRLWRGVSRRLWRGVSRRLWSRAGHHRRLWRGVSSRCNFGARRKTRSVECTLHSSDGNLVLLRLNSPNGWDGGGILRSVRVCDGYLANHIAQSGVWVRGSAYSTVFIPCISAQPVIDALSPTCLCVSLLWRESKLIQHHYAPRRNVWCQSAS